jgi:prefoldin subunit 5
VDGISERSIKQLIQDVNEVRQALDTLKEISEDEGDLLFEIANGIWIHKRKKCRCRKSS